MGVFDLPDGYREIKTVDFQKDKRLMAFVNAGAIAIVAAMFIVGHIIAPISLSINLLRVLVAAIAIIAYIVAHELVHGVFIKIYSGKKAWYGFEGVYAYAGSDAYFSKRQYVVIALSPVVLLGAVLLLLNILLPQRFWVIYIVQMTNLSGAAGDYYMTWLMSRLPPDVLVKDEGVSMTIYSKLAKE